MIKYKASEFPELFFYIYLKLQVMHLILFDNKHREGMLPLSYTRAQGEMRCGILTVKEKWTRYSGVMASCLSTGLISQKNPVSLGNDNLYISASVLPNKGVVKAVLGLNENEALVSKGDIIAVRGSAEVRQHVLDSDIAAFKALEYDGEYRVLEKVHNLITFNKDEIQLDFELLTNGRQSKPICESVTVVGGHKDPSLVNQIFIEEGAELECCYLNPKEGPIYIGKNAKVSEGAMLRGPIAICEASQISMGAKIFPGATVGPWSKVGGEVSNSVITGYSNKVHDGYLGDSVLGEWCNLGADTNTSNLKNDFAIVKLWDYSTERFAKTGLQFCGLIMGDYSRCAINTSFNSGTVVGVGSNIFGSGFPRNFVPSFVIGGPQGYKVNGLKPVEKVAKMAMSRRNVEFNNSDSIILNEVFEVTKKYRTSFK